MINNMREKEVEMQRAGSLNFYLYVLQKKKIIKIYKNTVSNLIKNYELIIVSCQNPLLRHTTYIKYLVICTHVSKFSSSDLTDATNHYVRPSSQS